MVTQSATAPRNLNPFTPATTEINTTSASQSARPVTLPHISELYSPLEQALDALVPRRTSPASKPATPAPAPAATKPNPFMDALRSTAADNALRENDTLTDNAARAYKSTLSPTLDAFASLSQATDHKDIAKLLAASWAADPAVTLRLIWNLRSIHEGKSAREQFYRAYAWLYANHPRTAISSLRFLVEPVVKRTIKRKSRAGGEDDDDAVMVSADPEKDDGATEDSSGQQEVEVRMPHGYWKDLLNILVLATVNQLTPVSDLSALHVRTEKQARTGEKSKKTVKSGEGEDAARARDAKNSEHAKDVRLQKHHRWHSSVLKKLASDKKYRALYITVARLFADGLARDLEILREIADTSTSAARRVALAFELTLVGKWAPSIGGSHDRVTSIATPIAELLNAAGYLRLPIAPVAQPLTQETAHRLRSAYARWVTAPLRRILQVPEVAMSAGRWNEVNYTRVPSHAMRANKTHFLRHDKERFSAYLLAVAQGKVSISGATLLPHELLEEGMALSSMGAAKDAELLVVEAQWKSLVEHVRESGTLSNALAVCDVSGSMGYLGGGRRTHSPIAPAVALSILLAQVSSAPWANTFITFSATPEIIALDTNLGLVENAQNMVQTHWGMNTDFNAIFTKLILPTAISHELKPSDMLKRLFVFSDMQFDASRRGKESWQTEHQVIKEEFKKAGYEMPEIVYWNLAGAVAKPVTKDEEGVALVSGFSPGMLKVFLEEGSPSDDMEVVGDATKDNKKQALDPIDTMLKALAKESFMNLEVLD